MTALDLHAVRLRTQRLELRAPRVSEAEALADFVFRNRQQHARWEPAREEDYFRTPWWRDHLGFLGQEVRAGRTAPFVGFSREDGALLLRANLSNVVRGAFHSAYLGFAVDAAHEGRGLAFEGVGEVVRFAFEELGLHRLQANHRPENERSAALLQRLGFRREGLAADYLHIDGAWRDHVMTAKLNPDWQAPD